MKNIPSKRLILVQIFIIFILPVFLLYFHILPLSSRFILLAVSALVIYGIIRREEWSFEEMGIRHDNFKKALPFYFSFVVVGVLALFFIDHKVNMPDIETKNYIIRTWIFFIPVSFFQEFAFRSFLIPMLKKLYSNNYIVIFLNAILFTLLHIIFPNLGIGLPIAFVSGILFAWLYLKYPNLVLISLAHSVLNIIAVLLGFFVIS
jgi:uncharacterized protein